MTDTNPRKKRPPIPPAKWDIADVSALQALEQGKATPEQQKRAIMWIVNNACLTYDFCDQPESDRLSAIYDGRRFAGLQIVKLIKLNMAALKANLKQTRGE